MDDDCWEARMSARAKGRQLVREVEEHLRWEARDKTQDFQGSFMFLYGDVTKCYIMNEFGQWEEFDHHGGDG